MAKTLAERAAKIQEDLQKLPKPTIQQNKQFFDDVWAFCGGLAQLSPATILN
jgi:hypothetical protein